MNDLDVVFITENNIIGKIPREHENMRTEFAWMSALNADHINISTIRNNDKLHKFYDLGIVILPKSNPEIDIAFLRKFCHKVAIMQEGPSWYYQDYCLEAQIQYINNLQLVDIIFVHNESDIMYFAGIVGDKNKIRVMRSLMISDPIQNLPQLERSNIIIGGNFCSWYGGMDSYLVARDFNLPIFIPSMGRRIANEENLPNLSHLPYMLWSEWIRTLNHFKYGIHLMRTFAAGTFALNCAYLGIPCIGYYGLDTQEICHPNLTVRVGDLFRAKELVQLLKNNNTFYEEQSKIARYNYESQFSEQQFINNFTKR